MKQQKIRDDTMGKSVLFNIALIVTILAVGGVGFLMLSSSEKTSNMRDNKPEIRTVETQQISFDDITLQIRGHGTIESKQTLDIVAETTGRVIYAKNNLKDGTYVRKGETIVKIDSREIENQLFSLRSEFMNAVAQILPELKIEENGDLYEKWYNYFITLDSDKEVPELPEVSDTKEKIKVSMKQIFTKYYNIKNQEILYSKHFIQAPFSGFVQSGGILENSFVSRGQKLFSMHDARNLEIAVPLLVRDFNMIDFTKSPQVKIYTDNSDDVMWGKVIRKETKMQKNSQSLNIYVSFVNNNLNTYFLPGNYVKVLVEGKELENVAMIPRHLISNDKSIFTMEEGKLAKRSVDILAMQDDMAVIKNNIPDHTQMVTTILQKPLVGMQIESTNMEKKETESEVVADSNARDPQL